MNSNRLGKYTHIRCVCEWCAVDVNLVQKQVNGWDTSEMKELVDQGVQSTLLILQSLLFYIRQQGVYNR